MSWFDIDQYAPTVPPTSYKDVAISLGIGAQLLLFSVVSVILYKPERRLLSLYILTYLATLLALETSVLLGSIIGARASELVFYWSLFVTSLLSDLPMMYSGWVIRTQTHRGLTRYAMLLQAALAVVWWWRYTGFRVKPHLSFFYLFGVIFPLRLLAPVYHTLYTVWDVIIYTEVVALAVLVECLAPAAFLFGDTYVVNWCGKPWFFALSAFQQTITLIFVWRWQLARRAQRLIAMPMT
ncbi:hypothetical protein C8J56DRAFT_948406 [Mycena floridula]|nr:hypothetical protein C8J56DRAFT_948406 [Mycena floridula]